MARARWLRRGYLALADRHKGQDKEKRVAESVVVCPEPPAAAVGEETLRNGGNVADAGVATAFAQCVTNPLGTGLGGMGAALVQRPDVSEPVSISATVEIGSRMEAPFSDSF